MTGSYELLWGKLNAGSTNAAFCRGWVGGSLSVVDDPAFPARVTNDAENFQWPGRIPHCGNAPSVIFMNIAFVESESSLLSVFRGVDG